MVSIVIDSDRVSGHASSNMAPWQSEYFKLKESEKTAGTGRSLGLPLTLSPLKQAKIPYNMRVL